GDAGDARGPRGRRTVADGKGVDGMTHRDDLELTLTAWFDADAAKRAPDGLADTVIARVKRTRRRPTWRVPERWLPMQATLRLRPLLQPVLRPIPLLITVALILALVGVAILAGGTHRVPLPFGPARDGLIAYQVNNQIVVSNVDGSRAKSLSRPDSLDANPIWSRDGTKVAYLSVPASGAKAQVIVEAPDGS